MINKRSIWFLTLFSLIIVLSIYYVTMPSELLLNTNGNYYNNNPDEKVNNEEEGSSVPTVNIEESSALVNLRVEAEEEVNSEIDELKKIILDGSKTVEEKNNAYDKMKDLNITKGEEEKIEKQILDTYKLKSFVRIKDGQVRVVLESKEHNVELANNIMRTVQTNFQNQMYISIKFQG